MSVDLPAPFSPSRARMEPPAASRSTPWRTSTPPNDLCTPRTARVTLIVLLAAASLLAGLRVDVADVLRRDDAVVRVDDLRLRLAVEQREQNGDDARAVELG